MVSERLNDGTIIVKLTFEISKNILLTASTFILAVVVATAGSVIISLPSLGVLFITVKGNVNPPSVDNKIFTLEQLTGEALVFATFQVIVWGLEYSRLLQYSEK